MTIAERRLRNQHIPTRGLRRPQDVVAWFGAMQAQEYEPAKWAIGLRMPDVTTSAKVQRACDEGRILRTHVMRPTWHFVTPADIRWMLMLTAPRVHQLSAYYNRQLQLDDTLFVRSDGLLAKALQGGKQLTRVELGALLKQAGIATDDLRLAYIVGHAELEAVICSGARRGKQFTYALVDERAPNARTLSRDEALAELARRYFASHGPATVQDFVWWSGLTVADARAGLDSVRADLIEEIIDGTSYWLSDSSPSVSENAAYLLSNYDEYQVGYKDRSASFNAPNIHELDPRGNFLFSHVVVIDDQIVGTWRRTFRKAEVVITPKFVAPLTAAQ